jgi:hypothetical protein
MDFEWVSVAALFPRITWFQWWCAGVTLGILVDLLYRGFSEHKRVAHTYLTLSWDVAILGAHLVTEDYRWIFLGHACKIAYMLLTRLRHAPKIIQVDAYYVLAFFLVVHGGAELGLETFDVLSWELWFHCLTLLYNAMPLLNPRDRPMYVFGLTLAWFAVRVLGFAWTVMRISAMGKWYYATVVASQFVVVVSLIKIR